jgi:hypothetical protein
LYDVSFDDGVCPTFVPRLYADILKSKPNLIGRIVVFPYLRANQLKIGNEWIEMFTTKYRVPRNQLRIVYAKPRINSKAEFWVEPVKKH